MSQEASVPESSGPEAEQAQPEDAEILKVEPQAETVETCCQSQIHGKIGLAWVLIVILLLLILIFIVAVYLREPASRTGGRLVWLVVVFLLWLLVIGLMVADLWQACTPIVQISVGTGHHHLILCNHRKVCDVIELALTFIAAFVVIFATF